MTQSMMIVAILMIVLSIASLATAMLALQEQHDQARMLDAIRIQLGLRQSDADGISIQSGERVGLGKGVQLEDGTFVADRGAA